jgi:hypothetical protein
MINMIVYRQYTDSIPWYMIPLQWYGFGVSSNGNTKDHSILIIINITRIVNNRMLQNISSE